MQPRRLCPTCQAEFTLGEQFCAYDAAPLVDAPEPDGGAAGNQDDSSAGKKARELATRWATDPLLGTTIADRYLLREVLGEGGMGMVYRADHTTLDRSFAVKVLRRELTL